MKRNKGATWNALGSTMYGVNSFVMLALVSRVGTVEEAGHFGIAFTTAQLLYIIGLFGVPHYHMTDYGEKYSFECYAKVRIATCLLMLVACFCSVFFLGFTGQKCLYTILLTVLMLLNVIGELYQSLFFQKNRLDLSGSALFFRTLWPLIIFCATVLIFKNIVLALAVQIVVNLLITLYYAVTVAPSFLTKKAHNKPYNSFWQLFTECIPLAFSLFLETLKGIKLEHSLEFAKNTKKLKIKVFGCFMIGLKGDNLETIEETFRFAKKVYPDMCFFQQAVPFPGTEFYRWVKESGYLRTEDYSKWLNPDGYLDCLVDYPYADHKQIEKILDNLMSRYYFSFTYIFKTFLANLSWVEFKRVMKSGFNYILFRIKKLGK